MPVLLFALVPPQSPNPVRLPPPSSARLVTFMCYSLKYVSGTYLVVRADTGDGEEVRGVRRMVRAFVGGMAHSLDERLNRLGDD